MDVISPERGAHLEAEEQADSLPPGPVAELEHLLATARKSFNYSINQWPRFEAAAGELASAIAAAEDAPPQQGYLFSDRLTRCAAALAEAHKSLFSPPVLPNTNVVPTVPWCVGEACNLAARLARGLEFQQERWERRQREAEAEQARFVEAEDRAAALEAEAAALREESAVGRARAAEAMRGQAERLASGSSR